MRHERCAVCAHCLCHDHRIADGRKVVCKREDCPCGDEEDDG